MLVSQEQALAVSHIGHALIVAVPGSGKTRTLIAKTVAMVEAGYSRIGIASFTNASAKELEERLISELDASLVHQHVTVSTFHSMLLNHIKSNIVGKGLVSQDFETTHLLSILTEHGFNASNLDEFKQYFNRPAEERKESDLLFEPSEQYLREVLDKEHITLSNVIAVSNKMIIEGRLPPLPFTNLFVDEFQDSDDDMVKLLLVHGVSGVNICAVGDDDQSIYSWRSAKGVEAFNALKAKLSAHYFILKTNYRSHREITDFANDIICRNKKRIVKNIVSHKGTGGVVTLTRYQTPYEESLKVSQLVNKLVQDGHDGEIFIIARSNASLDICREYLTVEFDDIANKNSEPFEAQVLKTGLKALVENNVHQLAMMLSVYMPKERAMSVATSVCYNNANSAEEFEHTQALSHVKSLLSKNHVNDAITEFIAYTTPHMLRTCENTSQSAQQIEKRKQRMHRSIAFTQERLLKIKGSLKQRLEVLSRQKEKTFEAKVKLMTIHGAKGLEAETVFLIGVCHKKMPSSMAEREARNRGSKYQNQLIEEERRLLFVAVTRAQTMLHVSCYQGTETRPNANGYSKLLPPNAIENLPNIHEYLED